MNKSLKEKRWDDSGKGDYAISYEDVKEAVLEFERFVKQSIIDDGRPDIKLIMLNFRQIFGDWANK